MAALKSLSDNPSPCVFSGLASVDWSFFIIEVGIFSIPAVTSFNFIMGIWGSILCVLFKPSVCTPPLTALQWGTVGTASSLPGVGEILSCPLLTTQCTGGCLITVGG